MCCDDNSSLGLSLVNFVIIIYLLGEFVLNMQNYKELFKK